MPQLLRREPSPPLPWQLFMAIVLTLVQWYRKASVPLTLQALRTRKRCSTGAAEAIISAHVGPLLCTFEAGYGTPSTYTGTSVTPAMTSAASTPSGLVPGSGPSGTSNSALDAPAVAGSQGGAAGRSGCVVGRGRGVKVDGPAMAMLCALARPCSALPGHAQPLPCPSPEPVVPVAPVPLPGAPLPLPPPMLPLALPVLDAEGAGPVVWKSRLSLASPVSVSTTAGSEMMPEWKGGWAAGSEQA